MKVSIITVCFNSEKYISDCIDSVNCQSYPNIEHIFIDGNSSDNTTDIIVSRSKRNMTLISERDEGIYDAMNKGLRMASGEVIGFLNSDDLFDSEFVVDLFYRIGKTKENIAVTAESKLGEAQDSFQEAVALREEFDAMRRENRCK